MADLDLTRVFQDEWMRIHRGQIVTDDEDDGTSIIADFNQVGASGDELVQVAEVTHERDGTRHLVIIGRLRLYFVCL
jgi:hypothetical protein